MPPPRSFDIGACSLAAFSFFTFGCGQPKPKAHGPEGGTPSDSGADAPDGAGAVGVRPHAWNSGYDGVHDYAIRVYARVADIRVSDPSYVDVKKDGRGVAILTMKKPGTVTIRVDGDVGNRFSAKLVISKYTPQQWEIGEELYNRTDIGWTGPDGTTCEEARCVTCHGTSDTPDQIGGYSDAELAKVFERGRLLPERPYSVSLAISQEEWSTAHRWKLEEVERKGVLAYLRSISPLAFSQTGEFGGGEPLPLGDVAPCPADGRYTCQEAPGMDFSVCVEMGEFLLPPRCETREDCVSIGLDADCLELVAGEFLCIQVCDYFSRPRPSCALPGSLYKGLPPSAQPDSTARN